MTVKTLVKTSAYYDSITLMILQKELSKLEGVEEVGVVMGTPHNKEVLKIANILTKEAEEANADDLVISVSCENEEKADEVFKKADELLNQNKGGSFTGVGGFRPKTLDSAVKQLSGANMAIISIPGKYAKDEVEKALDHDLNVMLFSDNVDIEDELYLKTKAMNKGLLLMGPDCGTSIINNTALAFANVIRKGNIGIVGASGTGIQEVTVLINEYGAGISQAIGTGGRDLSEKIGGITMLQGIEALNEDEATEIIVLISKPPSEKVVPKIMEAVKNCKKTVIINFIGGAQGLNEENVYYASTLEEAAKKAVELVGINNKQDSDGYCEIDKIVNGLQPGQKYIRGLFSGGTLCYESLLVLRDYIGNAYSNTPLDKKYKLENANVPYQHTLLDLGDDEFTVGRPHPMIDMTLRAQKIIHEARNPEVALLLIDVVLGYGSHKNPVEELAPAIQQAKLIAQSQGRELPVIAYVCGTNQDPQDKQKQIETLKEVGAIIAFSNVEAARIAGKVAASLEKVGEVIDFEKSKSAI